MKKLLIAAGAAVLLSACAGGMSNSQMSGGPSVTASGSNVMVTDEKGGTAMVSIANAYPSNGVIHVVNKMLVPN